SRLTSARSLQVVPTRTPAQPGRQEADLGRLAREIGANLLVCISFWIQDDNVRATYRIVTDEGAFVKSGSVDGSMTNVFALADRRAETVAKDLEASPLERRTPTPPELETPEEWKAYLDAVGLLVRYDRRDSVEAGLRSLESLAVKRPASCLVQAALGRASLSMFTFTKDRSWAERALRSAETARRLCAGSVEVEVTFGETQLATGHPKEAVQTFRGALTSNPDDFTALLGLGRACEDAGEDAAAESAFRRAIDLQPGSFAGYNQLGGFYYDKGRYAAAAEMFRKASRMAPDSYRALYNLGGASTMSCDFAVASDAYRKALALQPDNAYAANNLGLN